MITEADVDWVAEIRAADVIADEEWEHQRAAERADWLLFNRPMVGVS
jgi:hypothetical protein